LAIKEAIHDGRIIIEPFDETLLGGNSYDIRIGSWIVRQRDWAKNIALHVNAPIIKLENGQKIDGDSVWEEPHDAGEGGTIVLRPGELILAHTIERIGCFENVVAEMKSRSSAMRLGQAICIDAGLGDVGFDSRWTMEVYNHLARPISIPVGARVGQMTFHEVAGNSRDYYVKGGTYGSALNWTPNDMIPRSRM